MTTTRVEPLISQPDGDGGNSLNISTEVSRPILGPQVAVLRFYEKYSTDAERSLNALLEAIDTVKTWATHVVVYVSSDDHSGAVEAVNQRYNHDASDSSHVEAISVPSLKWYAGIGPLNLAASKARDIARANNSELGQSDQPLQGTLTVLSVETPLSKRQSAEMDVELVSGVAMVGAVMKQHYFRPGEHVGNGILKGWTYERCPRNTAAKYRIIDLSENPLGKYSRTVTKPGMEEVVSSRRAFMREHSRTTDRRAFDQSAYSAVAGLKEQLAGLGKIFEMRCDNAAFDTLKNALVDLASPSVTSTFLLLGQELALRLGQPGLLDYEMRALFKSQAKLVWINQRIKDPNLIAHPTGVYSEFCDLAHQLRATSRFSRGDLELRSLAEVSSKIDEIRDQIKAAATKLVDPVEIAAARELRRKIQAEFRKQRPLPQMVVRLVQLSTGPMEYKQAHWSPARKRTQEEKNPERDGKGTITREGYEAAMMSQAHDFLKDHGLIHLPIQVVDKTPERDLWTKLTAEGGGSAA